MTGSTKQAQPLLLQSLEVQFRGVLKTDALNPLRQLGWKKFQKLGLPYRTQDEFKYIRLQGLHTLAIDRLFDTPVFNKVFLDSQVIPESRHSYITFVNGRFAPELSDLSSLPPQVRVLPLSEAAKSHAAFLQQHMQQQVHMEQDPFAALNLALHPEGMFIYIPPKVVVNTPIQCLQIITASFAAPRIQIVAGAHTQTEWIFSSLDCTSSALSLPLVDFTLEEGAEVKVYSVEPNQQHLWHFSSLRATIKKQASFYAVHVSGGGKTSRLHANICLKGEEGKTQLKGLWNLSAKSCAHYHMTVEHKAPNTCSLQHFKGILNDGSQSSFEGKIKVDPEAQGTRAYQLNNNLLLSRGAIANSKPNLEIFADDVKASHGATVSQLNDDELFYLHTRGLTPEQSKKILVNAYLQEILQEIPYTHLVHQILRDIL